MIEVSAFFQIYQEALCLELCAGEKGLNRQIKVPEMERPGLALTGFFKGHSPRRILIFGKVEMEYLRELSPIERKKRLLDIAFDELPLIIITRRLKPFKEMLEVAEEKRLPLFRTSRTTSEILRELTALLGELFAPTVSRHGTLVEAFGLGVLIEGDSSVGKSEAALGLIERGHRLISDDIVIIKKQEGGYLLGTGPELTRHMLEIRGIGIINVGHLYGAVCISQSFRVDLIVKLEAWDDGHFYDRVGLEEKYLDILDIEIPFYVMPVKPGRDVVLLLETVVLNHRLKKMGYNSAKEFNVKLLETISKNLSR